MGVVLILMKKNMGVVLILKKAPDDLADQFYSHGSWYKNPEESPFAGHNGYYTLFVIMVILLKKSYIICHNGYPPKNHTLFVIMVNLQKYHT